MEELALPVRFDRYADMDVYAAEGEPFRCDQLRELVDRLPERQKHIIERLFFGGADLLSVAAEIGISPKRARELRAEAFESLRAAVLEDDSLGPVLSAVLGVEP